MDQPGIAELQSLAAELIERLGEPPLNPTALTCLLRLFGATGRDDIRERLGEALTLALDTHQSETRLARRAAWLSMFRQALALSDDDRLASAAAHLALSIRDGWRASTGIGESMCAVDACLGAAGVASDTSLVADAVDELERLVGRAYNPGDGIGDCADQVRTSAALLTAYEVTGRVPYAMLAEELMHASGPALASAAFIIRCEAVRALCRLAALHDDADYRAAAVIAPDANYRADARRILGALPHHDGVDEAAIYALALSELLNVTIESPDVYGH